jgi:hypothetical protein
MVEAETLSSEQLEATVLQILEKNGEIKNSEDLVK